MAKKKKEEYKPTPTDAVQILQDVLRVLHEAGLPLRMGNQGDNAVLMIQGVSVADGGVLQLVDGGVS